MVSLSEFSDNELFNELAERGHDSKQICTRKTSPKDCVGCQHSILHEHIPECDDECRLSNGCVEVMA